MKSRAFAYYSISILKSLFCYSIYNIFSWQAFGQLAVMLSLLGGLFAFGWWLNVPETQSYAVCTIIRCSSLVVL